MLWLYVAIGGAIGSMMRYGCGTLLNQSWPLGTWLVNVVGSFLIGILFVIGKEKTSISPEMYVLLATGFMGGFTTFSSFSLEVVTMALAGKFGAAIFYSMVSIVVGISFTFAGIWLARHFTF